MIYISIEDLEQNGKYEKLNNDTTQQVTNKVRKIVKRLHQSGMIDDELKQYMMPNNINQGRVKANPKILKQNNPIRTIISTVNHPTEKMAEVAEHELDEWVKQLPMYIKDTTDFLEKLDGYKDILPQKCIAFTMDVKALYPSVPRKEGLEACKRALDARKNHKIPTDAMITLMTTVLKNNIFKFGDQNYRQKDGTAIGSKLGKHFSCTYMGEWETELLHRCAT